MKCMFGGESIKNLAPTRKKVNRSKFPQIEILNFFDVFEEQHAENEKAKAEIVKDLKSYLEKGERLILTAQKIKRKEVSSFLDRCCCSKAIRKAAETGYGDGLVDVVATYIFRPLLAEITRDMPDEKKREKLDAIKQEFFPESQISLCLMDDERIPSQNRLTAKLLEEYPTVLTDRKNKESAVAIAAVWGGKVCFGTTTQVKKSVDHHVRVWRRYKESFCVEDTAHVCAIFALKKELNNYLSRRREELVQKFIEPVFLPLDKECRNLTELYISSKYAGYVLMWKDQTDGKRACMVSEHPLAKAFCAAVFEYGFCVEVVSEEEMAQLQAKEDIFRFEWSRVEESGMLKYLNVISSGIADPDVVQEIRQCPHGLYLQMVHADYAAAYIHSIIPAVDQEQQMRRSGSDYALSWQTKKNIPKATLKYMAESGFNNYFGYVEVDEECDLEKISETYSLFVAFHEAALWWVKGSESVSLRFRRLGNHKASGLYYPGIKCLCVSSVEPSAFVHEYGHMIDSLYGDLSQQAEFANVYGAYESILRKLPAGSFSKGKYNLQYYLEPTEVFARSFEIYFKCIRGYDNALIGQCTSAVYPKASEYLGYVEAYFDELIAKQSV